ncbi:MAG: P-type conjugative transfer protein TrbL [Devosia sp.]
MVRYLGYLLAGVAFLLVASSVMAQATLHDPVQVYDGVLSLVRNTANGWSAVLRGYATNLFMWLSVISMVWRFGNLGLRNPEFSEVAAELIRFFVVTGIFYTLMLQSEHIASAIINSFRQAGATAAGVGAGTGLMPGDMFGLGVELAKTLTFPTINPMLAVHSAFSGLIILLCFSFIAAFMGITLIQSYVIINASVLLMGFGGSEWTREYAISMLKGAFYIGVKLFILTLLVGLISHSARGWQQAYTHDDTSTFALLGMAFVFAYMVKTVPDMMAELISGVSPGGGGVIGGMAAAGAAGAAAGMAVLQSSGLMGAAKGLLGGGSSGVSDLLKGSGGKPGGSGGMGGASGGGASFMNSPGGGGGGGGSSGGPSGSGPRVGGGGRSAPPSSGQSASSPLSSTPQSSPSSSEGSSRMATAAHVATDALVRTAGVASAISIPGAEGLSSASIGSPPVAPDLSDSPIGDTPGNIIRPATNAPASPEAPAQTASNIDTMAGLEEAMNRGNDL